MIVRQRQIERVQGLLARNPAVAVLGARRVGKTTLAAQLAHATETPVKRFDLENPKDLAQLADPMLALENLRGLVVLDEIQRLPEVFGVLRVLCDREGPPARFLVLGSASPDLLRQTSESLAGRIAFHELDGFSLDEIGMEQLDRLWVRGAFPRSFLAQDDAESEDWRHDFIRTYLERDLNQLGIRIPSETMRRFWGMLAHYHGQVWNSSEFARSFGVSDHTVRKYLGILESTYLIRRLQPWFENIGKRQVKAPKVYVNDSGLLHSLLGLATPDDLMRHPKVGASWEGFGVKALVDCLEARPEECYFWATHTGAELDLLVVRGTHRYGFEFKRTTAPKVTPSIRSAMESLRLREITVLHAGESSFPLAENIRAVALCRILEDLDPIR